MTECTRTVSPADVEGLRALLAEASDGSVICFTSGEYRVNLTIEKSLTLRAVGQVVLDGGLERSTLRIVKDGISVVLDGFILRRGSGGGMGNGGNVHLDGAAPLTVRNATLEAGRSENNGGGGVFVNDGEAVFERCRFVGNQGPRASGILVDGSGRVTLRETLVVGSDPSPAVRVVGDAALSVERPKQPHGPALEVTSKGGVAPRVSVTASIVGQWVARPPAVSRTHVSGSALLHQVPSGASDRGNIVGAIELDAAYAPAGAAGAALQGIGYRP